MTYRLTFLTVLPAPYQRELFTALNKNPEFNIKVLYYTKNTSDHEWVTDDLRDHERILPGIKSSYLGHSAILNTGIISELKQDVADLFIVSDYSAPSSQLAMRYLNRASRRWAFWGERPGIRTENAFRNYVRSQLQKPIIQGASAIVAIGQKATVAYRQLTNSQVPIFNIPYYCDISRYQQKNGSGNSLRKKEDIRVLFSGQLTPRKGPDLLVNAFINIANAIPNMKLVFLGNGPERDKLYEMIPANLKKRVEFLGFLQSKSIPPVFLESDIFVLPSRYDGWGVVINEALAAGLPIIASDQVGAAQDLVIHGVNGIIVSSDNVGDLTNALMELGSSEALRMSYSTASSKMAQGWRLEDASNKWKNLCNFLISG